MKGRAVAKIFSLLFGATYFTSFLFEIVPFRYYPWDAVFRVAEQPAAAGPPILWYGWIATAAGISGLAAVIVPSRWADRLWHGLSWMVPAVVILVMLIYECRWFL